MLKGMYTSMKHYSRVLFWAVLFVVILALPVLAQEAKPIGSFGDWEAYRESDAGKTVCFIGSEPKKSSGKHKKRGDVYVLVTHRTAEKSSNVISVKAGYTYQSTSEVDLIIGSQSFKLFTDKGDAFAYDSKMDKDIVTAMIRGAKMVIKGTSSRGTKTTDVYSLKGFSAAFKTINAVCKVK